MLKIRFEELKTFNKLIVNDFTIKVDKGHENLPAELYEGKTLIATIPTTKSSSGVPIKPMNLLPFVTVMAMGGAIISQQKEGVFDKLQGLSEEIFSHAVHRQTMGEQFCDDPKNHKYLRVCLDNGAWSTEKEIQPGIFVNNEFYVSSNVNSKNQRFMKVISITDVASPNRKNIVRQELRQVYVFTVPFGEFGFKHELVQSIK
ncbi:hypothetical protein [Stenotrophomonas phage BUCTxx100]|nr:hypothetical protein [Stenotrophomonas phage BUCTxx100]